MDISIPVGRFFAGSYPKKTIDALTPPLLMKEGNSKDQKEAVE